MKQFGDKDGSDVLRRDIRHSGQRMLGMELSGNRKNGRHLRRFMDVVEDDMEMVEVKAEEAGDRVSGRWIVTP